MRRTLPLVLCLLAAACGGREEKSSSAPAPKPATARATIRQPLEGGPFPALLLAQAQFVDATGADGKPTQVPGPAKLTIARQTPSGWKTVILEDPDSNVFHKAIPWEGGVLTIGGSQAMLKTWKFADGQWTAETHWNPKFGGKFDRLRDIEAGDVDRDGHQDLVIATHDQGVIAIVHPHDGWRVEPIDKTPDTFVHEIEIADIDGDGELEFAATVSAPNKLDATQPGEVRMYKRGKDGKWAKTIVDAPGDTHAKEVMTADVDHDGKAEVFVAWEGAIGEGGKLVRPSTIKEYRWQDGKFVAREVAEIPDRQLRALAAGDLNGDGKVDVVGGGLGSGLWIFEQGPQGWTKSLIDADSSGFEQPVLMADLDHDGKLELYVGSEDQQQLRRYRWVNGTWEKTTVAPLVKGDITWNMVDANL